MSMFKREEDLLVAIHDGQHTIEARNTEAFEHLLAQELVSGADTGDGRYEDVLLTAKGRSRIPAIIQRD